MNKYLQDAAFLKQIDLQQLKEQYIKITVLDWQERPIQDLTGRAIGGSINIDGKSNIRRTANLNVFMPSAENNITNPERLLSINKKISFSIGIKNTTELYLDNPILWFPMGVYVIINTSISHTTSGISVSLTLKDKMCLLNGECGGILPASINFNEIETVDENGNPLILYPTIYQIIQEAVNHWGKEQLGKIIISDLDTKIKKVMKWVGQAPVYYYNRGDIDNLNLQFTTNVKDLGDRTETISLEDVKKGNTYIKYTYGQDIGFILTDFTYVGGDLIGDSGNSVCDILEQIKNTLGNYEYFYDIDGNFRFQEIKNYLNTSQSTVELNNLKNEDYLVDQSKGKAVYDFNDSTLIAAYNNNPQFNMIKNDFIVWGMRKDATGKAWPIRYHLAIDQKPIAGKEHIVFQYKDAEDNLLKAKATLPFEIVIDKTQGQPGIFYYNKEDNAIYTWSIKEKTYVKVPGELQKITSQDWRTELYLQGVDAEPLAIDSNDYYVELQNEWPKLYNIWDKDKPDFYQKFKNTPSDCDYFLDFIDSTASVSEFSISNIGRRTKTVTDDKINCLFAPQFPDIVLIEKGSDKDTDEYRQECNDRGWEWSQIDSNLYSALSGGGHANAAYDTVRDLLYQYTSYNETITIQCVPIYYLDVNTRIHVVDLASDISGDYMINSISIPLDISSTISISASKALDKI